MEEENYEWIEGKDFDDWLEKNKEEIERCLRWDSYELLYQAWFAGYVNGMDYGVKAFAPFSGMSRKG